MLLARKGGLSWIGGVTSRFLRRTLRVSSSDSEPARVGVGSDG